MLLADKLVDYHNPDSLVNVMRRRRSHHIAALIDNAFTEFGECRILDIGGTFSYWKIFDKKWLQDRNASVVLLNLAPVQIPESDQDTFNSVVGNACNLDRYMDGEFELVHSNSVIEHVGSWEKMAAMAAESQRVGKSSYHQTPYYWFPIEPHFFFPFLHWMPLSLRVKLARRMSLGSWPRAKSVTEAVHAQTSAVLLDKSMMKELFTCSSIEFERFCFMPKSLIAVRSLN